MSKKNEFVKPTTPLIKLKEKSEFVLVLTRNRKKISKALNDFFIGVKNEASDTKETSRIIVKFVAKQKISKDEEKHLKGQVYDVFKILGIGVPFILIPGATILIPLILRAAEKRGIDLFPSNFKSKDTTDSTIKK